VIIDQDGEEVQEPSFLEGPIECRCPRLVKESVSDKGINCTRLFEQAYLDKGFEESFARALLMMFLSQPKEEQDQRVPLRVVNYIRDSVSSKYDHLIKGKCLGCSLKPVGFLSYLQAYARVWPRVDKGLLVWYANRDVEVESMYPMSHDLSTAVLAEKVWQNMQDLGALDEEDDLGTLMRGE